MHTRRQLVRAALATALFAALRPGVGRAAPNPRFVGYPFTLGVASGYPTPTGVTLWTRLAPAPLQPDGGMTPEGVEVSYEVAEDPAFAKPVAAGVANAYPEHGHSVRVDVSGLAPGRWYHYRFRAGHEVSPVGRTRTAEAPGTAVASLRFALGSCQHYEQGYFSAHRHLADEGLDLMLFLGDYIYEATWGDNLVRRTVGGETVTLGDYRVRHAQYKCDPDLQRLHAAAPWAVVWDDHEVDNDWAADLSEHADPVFMTRRAAAFQAYIEHMPLPASMRLSAQGVRLHTTLGFGDLARFYLLDDRQYRSPQACEPIGSAGSAYLQPGACADLARPDRTLLGGEQERWLDGAFSASRERWNVLAQQTLFVPAATGVGNEAKVWTDGWDGYPFARQALLDRMLKRELSNPMIVGGDVHATVIADVHRDPQDPTTPIVAAEVCGTSISSQGGPRARADALMAAHRHVRYANAHQRGYNVITLTPAGATVETRAVDEKDRASAVETVARFRVEAGRRGLIAE